MSGLSRLYVSILLAVAAFWMARGVGIPAWRTWEPGDASDIALFVFTAVFIIARQVRP